MQMFIQYRRRTHFSRVHVATAVVVAASVLLLSAERAYATTVNMSNGPTVVRATKQYGAGTGVQMAKITAIPNASSVNVYMQIGSNCDNPLANSATMYGQRVNSIPSLGAFNGWAANNCVAVRGNHNYNANVNNVIPK